MALLSGPISAAQGFVNDLTGLNNHASEFADGRIAMRWRSALGSGLVSPPLNRTGIIPFSEPNTLAVNLDPSLTRIGSVEFPGGSAVQIVHDDAGVLAIHGRVLGLGDISVYADPVITTADSVSPQQSSLPVDQVVMYVNPNTITWKQEKRYSETKVRDGTRFQHFENAARENNDVLRLSFNGSTGNIDLRSPGGLDKLKSFYSLYLMSREPEFLPGGAVNTISLTYASKLFPEPFILEGFFDSVVNFSETAGKPHSRDYSFDFVVTSLDEEFVFRSFGRAVASGGLR
jgi:hypothetical protein